MVAGTTADTKRFIEQSENLIKIYGNGRCLPIQIAQKSYPPKEPQHPFPTPHCKHTFRSPVGPVARSFLPNVLTGRLSRNYLVQCFQEPKILLSADTLFTSSIIRSWSNNRTKINKLQYVMGYNFRHCASPQDDAFFPLKSGKF